MGANDMKKGGNGKHTLEKSLEKATRYVNVKPRTREQIRRYLKEKEFSENIIMETIKVLEEYRLIDDFQYSIMYFQYGFDKGRGIGRIKRELTEKGVASDIIEMAMEELEDIPDQFKAAMETGEKMLVGIDMDELDYEGRKKLQARIGRKLVSRGYSSEVVYKVINRLV